MPPWPMVAMRMRSLEAMRVCAAAILEVRPAVPAALRKCRLVVDIHSRYPICWSRVWARLYSRILADRHLIPRRTDLSRNDFPRGFVAWVCSHDRLPERPLSQIHYVHVSSSPGVIREIPSRMVRVFVNDDRVRRPVPVGHVGIVERSHLEVSVVKPESLAVTSLQVKNMARSKTEREAAVFERVIYMEPAVVRPVAIMSDPLPVGVDVRSLGMARDITILTLGSFAFPFARLRRGRAFPLLHRRRAVRWNVASTDTSVLFLFVFVPAAPILTVSWNQQGHREG